MDISQATKQQIDEANAFAVRSLKRVLKREPTEAEVKRVADDALQTALEFAELDKKKAKPSA